MKLCIDCKYCDLDKDYHHSNWYCLRPRPIRVCPVTGGETQLAANTCVEERHSCNTLLCCQHGEFFEKRNKRVKPNNQRGNK